VKVVILAGGLGTRLAEQTEVRPKPMVEIGGRPILWHIMKAYAHHGFNEFVIALGYKGEVIKKYFRDYYALDRNMTINLGDGNIDFEKRDGEDWIVHLVGTGTKTNTGGRLKRLEPLLKNSTFLMTYGDGVSNVNIKELLKFHQDRGCMATLTAVRPPARFGGLSFNGDYVFSFIEKPQIGEGWINGGFFVFEPGIFDYITEGDGTSLEGTTLPKLAEAEELAAFRHYDFWQCMDTIRDMKLLNGLWDDDSSPWKIWE